MSAVPSMPSTVATQGDREALIRDGNCRAVAGAVHTRSSDRRKTSIVSDSNTISDTTAGQWLASHSVLSHYF